MIKDEFSLVKDAETPQIVLSRCSRLNFQVLIASSPPAYYLMHLLQDPVISILGTCQVINYTRNETTVTCLRERENMRFFLEAASWQATAKPAIVEIVREGELAKIGSNVI